MIRHKSKQPALESQEMKQGEWVVVELEEVEAFRWRRFMRPMQLSFCPDEEAIIPQCSCAPVRPF